MAQSKVTEFFSSRKRNADFQPSKRRKVISTSDVHTGVTNEEESIAAQTKSVRSRGRKAKAVNTDTKVKVASTSTSKQIRKKIQCASSSKSVQASGQSRSVQQSSINPEKTPDIVAEPTEFCDDHHANPPSTPTKRTSTATTTKNGSGTSKRIRNVKAVRKDLLKELEKTPEPFDFSKFVENSQSQSVRKRLVMRRSVSADKATTKIPESLSPKQVGVVN